MNEKHYKEKLSRFVDHELAADERQRVAEHLLQCAECRAEHDEVKLGAAFAETLEQTNAPAELWRKIEASLTEKREKPAPFSNLAFFRRRALTIAALLIAGALTLAIYLAAPRTGEPEIAGREPPPENTKLAAPAVSKPDEIISNGNQTSDTNASDQTAPAVTSAEQSPRAIDSGIKALPNNQTARPKDVLTGETTTSAAWDVETLAGKPRINDLLAGAKLAVGEILETDAVSRARVAVADIGNVEIAPNSRVKLVDTKATEHRLSLEKGTLKAQILAPPRLFIVDTPSAVAVDLGCEYTLEVDAQGNSRLHVTSGFVALENGRHESIVPAGAIALTRKNNGIGTPFADDSSAALQSALYRLDFENGGAAALETVIKESNLYDSITLWHLLSRVEGAEREKVFEALAARVKAPRGVTRAGILRLDRKMLAAWWTAIENVWFE